VVVRPALSELGIADPPARWAALGFAVAGPRLEVGGVQLRLGEPGEGIVSWTIRGVEVTDIDGLVTLAAGPPVALESPRALEPQRAAAPPRGPEPPRALEPQRAAAPPRGPEPPRVPPPEHPNGAVALDHVVVVTPDFDRTAAALAAAGLPLRRIRDAGGFCQGFRRLGPAILELVESREAPPGPATLWGLVVVVPDLDALALRLGEHLSGVRDAVQPGRRIATVRRSAGLGPALAFMDPEPT
jgi:hypothetical protein